jgi:hypothetical protein
MDAFDFANYAKTFSNQKRLIREKYQKNLVLFYNGGKFAATKETLSYLNSLVTHKADGPLVDDNGVPIWIENYRELLNKLFNLRLEAEATYYKEFEDLRNNRTVQGLVNE